MNEQTLTLRDIHLPEAISWWPVAPGWWLVLGGSLLIIAVLIIAKKIYRSRQLGRDIRCELETIKQQFQKDQNKVQLAKSLSRLLRRANISYYPQANIAGLTGENWLSHLDKTNTRPYVKAAFNSDTGKILLSAPYLPEEISPDFDAPTLIALCESWLTSTHTRTQVTLP